ncbi:MAG: aminotransferase class V-fold PLP-dependent enzyme [Thermoanaerobaculia bacterium]|nr:aminotransferase class V-fold PLP-dependent enzyme [Thermoanaerobaculia bacterium]
MEERAGSAAVALAALRRDEFARLDAAGEVYVDYTGGGLYAASQVERHAELLRSGVFGNPHSANPASTRATALVEAARARVLDYFRADPREYVAIFTANASQALKLVGESYPFEAGDRFLLTYDNHNSVNGIREFDRLHGAATTYVPLGPDLRVEAAAVERELERGPAARGGPRHGLFAYPAQSNFSGVQHPLAWIGRAQALGWDVLLDAAAFVPANRLDLSRVHPDFVCLSFYKMFGYPTGVGALLARRVALAKLHRPWFAGGTITVASVQADRHQLAPGAAAFEDGTLDYLGVPAIGYGLELLDAVGVEAIHDHVARLTGRLIDALGALRHGNGAPVARLFGPRDTTARGGTVALNLYRADGTLVDHREIEARAGARRISLRTGCFCNPGAGETALGLSRDEIERCFPAAGDDEASGAGFEHFRQCLNPQKGTGAVRLSFGIASNDADLAAVLAFAASLVEAE